jgi:8-oxo-dGTP pyrophosphatase MutT (NUDIX family)
MTEINDLTVPIENSTLNIRVAVLAKTNKGFILEKSPIGYLYFIGGRIKINENSEEAAKRELYEEIGIKVDKLTFKTVIENFFMEKENKLVHEICFVYMVEEELEINNLPPKLVECSVADFSYMDIKPKILKDYILSSDNRPHIIFKDIN